MKTLLTATLLLVLFSGSARAENDDWVVALLAAAYTPEALVITGGAVTAIGGGLDLRSARPKQGWIVANFILGTINVATGIGILGAAVPGNWTPFLYAPVAALNLSVGITDIVIGALGAKKRMSGTIAPTAFRGSYGQEAWGIAYAQKF